MEALVRQTCIYQHQDGLNTEITAICDLPKRSIFLISGVTDISTRHFNEIMNIFKSKNL